MSPLDAYLESVRQHGMRALPDPERIVTALSRVDYRVPQRYGLEYEGLVYNSMDVLAYRIRRDVPKAVRIAVDPHDLTQISFLDPETNRFVPVPIQASMLKKVKGVTLQKHKLARALQLANPERLSGEAGLMKAYTIIDNCMRDLGAAKGRENRRDAARYWEALTKAKPPEEPPAFDTAASARGVSDGLFATMSQTSEQAPDEKPVPGRDDGSEEVRQMEPPRAAPAKMEMLPVVVEEPFAVEDDLEVIARRLGMTVKKD